MWHSCLCHRSPSRWKYAFIVIINKCMSTLPWGRNNNKNNNPSGQQLLGKGDVLPQDWVTYLSPMEVLQRKMWTASPLLDLMSPAPHKVCRPWERPEGEGRVNMNSAQEATPSPGTWGPWGKVLVQASSLWDQWDIQDPGYLWGAQHLLTYVW